MEETKELQALYEIRNVLGCGSKPMAMELPEMVAKIKRDLEHERFISNFDATRLRRLATLVGRSVPESDETLLGCAGTVLGGIALNVERVFKDHKLALEALHSLMVERDSARASLEWAVCRLYDTELITASRACELLGGMKMLDFRELYAKFPQEVRP